MEIGHVTTTVRRKFSRACGAEMLIYVPVSTTCCLALPLPSLVAGMYQGPFRKPLNGQSVQRELYLTPPPSCFMAQLPWRSTHTTAVLVPVSTTFAAYGSRWTARPDPSMWADTPTHGAVGPHQKRGVTDIARTAVFIRASTGALQLVVSCSE